MPERLTPGVYVEEVSGGVRPIQGVGTSTAGFIGEASRGIPDKAEFVNGFQDFERKFGGHRRGEAGFLSQAVDAFFSSGGRRAYVVRVLPSNAREGASQVVDARERDAWGLRRQVLQFRARGNGIWSQHIRVHIEESSSFKDQAFRVRVEWTEGGRSRTVETFDNVRMDSSHEDYVVDVINETSRYLRVDDLFQQALDAEERTLPPIPERVAALDTPAVDGGATYEVPEGATFEFRWRDSTSTAGPGFDQPATVTFDNETVTGADGGFDSGNAILTAEELRTLLEGALGDNFRVTIPAGPAELESEEGPWDVSGGALATFRIDDPPQRQLRFTEATNATINLGAGPFGGLAAGNTIRLTVNGVELPVYTLLPADAADFGAGMTVDELDTVLSREFTDVQVFQQGGELILRTALRSPRATLSLGGTAAGALGNPEAAHASPSAEIDLGAGPFAGLAAGSTIQLTLNRETPQAYSLVGGDAADFGAGMTVDELEVVLNREFDGVQAAVEGGNLTLRTTRQGFTATLALGGTAAPDLGGPTVVHAGAVSDITAVTPGELAAIFNDLPNNPFEARVEGNRVAFVQTDLSQNHAIQWVANPGPDDIVSDTTEHSGPAAPSEPNVRVEPAVSSRAYLTFQLMEGQDEFDFTGINTVTLTATNGDGPANYPVDVSGEEGLTPTALAQRLEQAVEDQGNGHGVAVDAAGEYVVVSAGPDQDGMVLSVSAAGGGPPWRGLRSIPGLRGTIVDSQNSVEITVSEVIRPGVPRGLRSLFPAVRATGLDQNLPANPILRPTETEDRPLRLLGGSDGQGEVTLSQYRGQVTDAGRTGLHSFDTVDINMLVLPGKNTPGFLSVAMAYCDANDVFLIADGAGSVDRQFQISADDARQFIEGLPARSNNAAMFYPWIEVPDPLGVGRNPKRFVPPSGHVAGIFARTDLSRGVWKAPAGIGAVVNGAIDLQHQLVDGDQDLLNPIGLNCIRQFPNAGIVSWGARTLASDPEWRYVPVRRTALFLKESLRRGLQWAVFEPNDQELWDRIRVSITAFMLGLFRQGAFQGDTPDQAFLVKCDRETNPQELVDQGIVTARVAFAPLKPAEFVVIEISQKALVG